MNYFFIFIIHVGEKIGEDIFEQIKDSEDRNFDIIFSVVPKKNNGGKCER